MMSPGGFSAVNATFGRSQLLKVARAFSMIGFGLWVPQEYRQREHYSSSSNRWHKDDTLVLSHARTSGNSDRAISDFTMAPNQLEGTFIIHDVLHGAL